VPYHKSDKSQSTYTLFLEDTLSYYPLTYAQISLEVPFLQDLKQILHEFLNSPVCNCPTHLIFLDLYPNNSWLSVQINKFLILQSLPFPC